MGGLRVARALFVGLSCAGLILPSWALEAAVPMASAPAPRVVPPTASVVEDVHLDAAGTLRGQVMNVRGLPAAGEAVVLWQSGLQRRRIITDARGRFWFGGLRGGIYQVAAGGRSVPVRAWAAETAPPAAREVALLVIGPDVVRGQMPLEEFFASDAVVIAGLVAAMIAIPIAVHNSGRGKPASP